MDIDLDEVFGSKLHRNRLTCDPAMTTLLQGLAAVVVVF